jgi:cytochrome c peroxidase
MRDCGRPRKTALKMREAARIKQARERFQPLPRDMPTADAPITPERVNLGRLLFFDPRLTIDADVSCSTYHQPERYGTDGLAKSICVKQRPHPRNAPTILSAGLNFIIHWRGDRESLEDQVVKALARQSPMANRTRRPFSIGSSKSRATLLCSRRPSPTIPAP